MVISQPVRSWWGWGWEASAYSDETCQSIGKLRPGLRSDPLPIPKVSDLGLRASRIQPPDSLAHIFTADDRERAGHTLGKAYRDVIRALYGQLTTPPDLVAYPTTEAEVGAVLDWASDHDVAVVPYGGGSSVAGGVEYRQDRHDAFVSLDLTRMNKVLEIDRVSRAACIQAGALGPVLEDQLRPHGYTLRHFPQSFEFSTLGGWIATRAGGHYATLYTHIDDFVEGLRAVAPTGVMESWRLPGSGAGPSPDRMWLGSEGIFGVITEAWMRIQDRPIYKRSVSAFFNDRSSAFNAVRTISQAALFPANCRLLDPGEAGSLGPEATGKWVLVMGAESAFAPVDNAVDHMIEIARDCGGDVPEAAKKAAPVPSEEGSTNRDAASEAWRSAFLSMPYGRDALARMGGIAETFETATTWDRIDDLYEGVHERLSPAIAEITGSPGQINCRFTHVYPDGAAPYFTVSAAAQPGAELSMWDEIKAASMEILGDFKATVTHHHSVGRDHRPGYDKQVPHLFAESLRAVKGRLDPAGIMNPGVLID